MGIMHHNAVIATTFSDQKYRDVMRWIKRRSDIEQTLFLAGEGIANNEYTIVLIPDGSKEGWEESDIGDALRQAFIERLQQDAFEDNSSPWRWIEVGYGEFGQTILRGNNQNLHGAEGCAVKSPESPPDGPGEVSED